ncbi:hypothetical protein GCM10010402_72870 [Actinomadura luteofluorescens]
MRKRLSVVAKTTGRRGLDDRPPPEEGGVPARREEAGCRTPLGEKRTWLAGYARTPSRGDGVR